MQSNPSIKLQDRRYFILVLMFDGDLEHVLMFDGDLEHVAWHACDTHHPCDINRNSLSLRARHL